MFAKWTSTKIWEAGLPAAFGPEALNYLRSCLLWVRRDAEGRLWLCAQGSQGHNSTQLRQPPSASGRPGVNFVLSEAQWELAQQVARKHSP